MSEAARSVLADGYSLYGCEWQGTFEPSDSSLPGEGIDDLYGAVAALDAGEGGAVGVAPGRGDADPVDPSGRVVDGGAGAALTVA